MTIFSVSDRDATLARVLGPLEADPRIEAAVVTGSLGADRADRWSDFDLDAVVADGSACEKVATEWVERLYRELPVAHHYETAFGTTLVRGFLLGNGLLADLAFTPRADFSVWAPVRVAFDRTGKATAAAAAMEPWSPTPDGRGEAGFAFHDVLHACVAANRDRPWQALYYLQRVRTRTLALASERHGFDADEFRHVDDLPRNERDPLLASLVTDLDRASLLGAIEIATRAFLDELQRGDPSLADRLAQPLSAFVRAWIDEPLSG
jgi:hypothetical protein